MMGPVGSTASPEPPGPQARTRTEGESGAPGGTPLCVELSPNRQDSGKNRAGSLPQLKLRPASACAVCGVQQLDGLTRFLAATRSVHCGRQPPRLSRAPPLR
jgi:hypothetical protein